MAKPAVIFGGPSDEHDISILTGLQVTRALGEVHAIYWSKLGDWFEVDTDLEAADFADGVPRKARELTFVAAPGQGLVAKKRPLDIDAVLIACHVGPGDGQPRLRSSDCGSRPSDLATHAGCYRCGGSACIRRALYRQAPVWRI